MSRSKAGGGTWDYNTREALGLSLLELHVDAIILTQGPSNGRM